MKRGMISLCFVLATALPYSANAQVIISEFLYDAAGSDSGQEWVELFNAGSDTVDLTKWKINDGSNHVLNVPPKNGGIGSIMLAPGAYIILADNAPNFIASYPSLANVIDSTLSLPNTSGTVSLLGEDGSVVDSLSYTKDQGGAGDGNTLQRNAVSSTALSALLSTPGAGSLEVSSGSSFTTGPTSGTESDTTTTTTSQTQTTTGAPVLSYVAPPVPEIFADGGADRTVIVGADTQFNARAYNRSKETLEKVRFIWNFGDGATAEGPAVLHHFDYPGRYVVVVNVAEDKSAGTDEFIVTAEPAKLSFSLVQNGGVAIENRAGRNLDLSGWLIRQSGGSFAVLFRLPDHSIILSGATMYITRSTLNFSATADTQLQYPNGTLALAVGQASPQAAPTSQPVVQTSVPPSVQVVQKETVSATKQTIAAPVVEDTSEPENSAIETESATSALVAAAGAATSHSSLWWFVAAIGLILLAGAALVFSKKLQKNEWDITEVK